MYYITEEVRRINCAEAIVGDIKLIDNKMVVAFGNLIIMEGGKDLLLNRNSGSFVNLCFVVFDEIETITFDFDFSRLIPLENRECHGGTNYLTGEHSEFWLAYKKGRILFTNQSAFKKIPDYFISKEIVSLLHENTITAEVLSLLGVIK
ncbi:hypothetical protein ACLI1A_16495 [Flavobacterium sp. RHBU_3]|uniref:hypothetical protein n=1 Tax=Flavobacterium sp. RHBU_3 TaxID=3391184 RepID=UPI003985308E